MKWGAAMGRYLCKQMEKPADGCDRVFTATPMSFEDAIDWSGALHLLGSPANAARLIESTKALDSEAGKAGFRLSPE
jgi:hypothetical protein